MPDQTASDAASHLAEVSACHRMMVELSVATISRCQTIASITILQDFCRIVEAEELISQSGRAIDYVVGELSTRFRDTACPCLACCQTIRRCDDYLSTVTIDFIRFKEEFSRMLPATLFRELDNITNVEADWDLPRMFSDPEILPEIVNDEDVERWRRVYHQGIIVFTRQIMDAVRNIASIVWQDYDEFDRAVTIASSAVTMHMRMAESISNIGETFQCGCPVCREALEDCRQMLLPRVRELLNYERSADRMRSHINRMESIYRPGHNRETLSSGYTIVDPLAYDVVPMSSTPIYGNLRRPNDSNLVFTSAAVSRVPEPVKVAGRHKRELNILLSNWGLDAATAKHYRFVWILPTGENGLTERTFLPYKRNDLPVLQVTPMGPSQLSAGQLAAYAKQHDPSNLLGLSEAVAV